MTMTDVEWHLKRYQRHWKEQERAIKRANKGR